MFLVGNSFPVSLIRRKVEATSLSPADFLQKMHREEWLSFWGHVNTLQAVNQLTGCDLTPRTERPALMLSPQDLPTLFGVVCRQCCILTPEYRSGFRPKLNEEVRADQIIGWRVVQLDWV